MSVFQRIQGIFFSPQATLKVISGKPVWVDALIVILILLGIYSYLVAPYIQEDTLKFFEENEIKLTEKMGKDAFEKQLNRIKNPSKVWIIIQSFLFSPISFLLFSSLLASLIVFGIGRFFSTEGKYSQILATLIHAHFIDKILGNALRLVLILSQKSVIQTTTSLAILFPRMEVTSTSYAILSQFDFFHLWLFGIFGLGLSYIFKIKPKKALFIAYSYWFLKSLANFGLWMVQKSFLGL